MGDLHINSSVARNFNADVAASQQKAKANKAKRVRSAPNPLIAAMTDDERQIPLF